MNISQVICVQIHTHAQTDKQTSSYGFPVITRVWEEELYRHSEGGATLSNSVTRTHRNTHLQSFWNRVVPVWESITVTADRPCPALITAVSPVCWRQEHHHHQTSLHLLFSHTTADSFSRSPTQLLLFGLFSFFLSSPLFTFFTLNLFLIIVSVLNVLDFNNRHLNKKD